MFGGGRGMGGGATGSSNMLRLVGRTVTTRPTGVTNLPEPISSPTSSTNNSSTTSPTSTSRPSHKFSSSNNNHLSLSSGPPSPACNMPISAHSNNNCCYWGSPFSAGEEYEWVSLDGSEDEKTINEDFILGPVPSFDEVHNAVSALNQVFGATSHSQFVRDKFSYNTDAADQISSPTGLLCRVSSVGAELDWVEPSTHLCNPKMLRPYGPDKVYDAFHLLQTEPSVQRMVISLSSDKAVWDAVLSNEAVQELRKTYYAENISLPGSKSSDEADGNTNPGVNVIMWMFTNTRAKFMELFEKITKLVNDLFKPPDEEKTMGAADPFEEKLRTSFMLSIVVLLIVVVTRAPRA